MTFSLTPPATVIVKVGSSSLTDSDVHLSSQKLSYIIQELSHLKRRGFSVILITSGAIATGCTALHFSQRPQSLALRQAAAAVGQSILMERYRSQFLEQGITVAQILLNRRDFSLRESFDNAHNALKELLSLDVVPIINENDTVSTKKETFGDNDMLAALVTSMMGAPFLIIVTDTDGVYTAPPQKDPKAVRIPYISKISQSILDACNDSGSSVGTGGMKSKLLAARHATSLGASVFIGRCLGSLGDKSQSSLETIISGNGTGTYLIPDDPESLSKKRLWIAYHAQSEGEIYIDTGAAHALRNKNASLLPVGVIDVKGTFQTGAVVSVLDTSLVGKGIVNFSSEELTILKGNSTNKVRGMTGRVRDEVIHRDEWVEF